VAQKKTYHLPGGQNWAEGNVARLPKNVKWTLKKHAPTLRDVALQLETWGKRKKRITGKNTVERGRAANTQSKKPVAHGGVHSKKKPIPGREIVYGTCRKKRKWWGGVGDPRRTKNKMDSK